MVVSFSNFSTNLITAKGSTFCDALGSEQIKCIVYAIFAGNMTSMYVGFVPSQLFVDL